MSAQSGPSVHPERSRGTPCFEAALQDPQRNNAGALESTPLIGLYLTVLCSGCAHPLATLTERKLESIAAGTIDVAFALDQVGEEARLARALKKAGEPLKRWGTLDHPVTVFLMKSHEDLEAAVRHHYGWLRAWAQYDDIFFQAPLTWGGPKGASDADVDELMLHELTHCLMFQLAATKDTWLDRKIPLWFREGMATWTANQGYKWPSLEDLARYWEQHPDADPLGDPDSMVEREQGVVYGAAHHCFTWLIKTHGEEDVHRILDAMRKGQNFNEAFAKVLSASPDAFIADFKYYIVKRGFRVHLTAGDGNRGGRSFPSSARCSSISCSSAAGATVETGTIPLSAPQ